MTEIIPLNAQRHAQDLRDTWQARALAETKGRLAATIFAILMHSYGPAMQILLRVVFPKGRIAPNGWTEISRPFFYGAATIDPGGRVLCGAVDKSGRKIPRAIAFLNEDVLLKQMRDLADALKLNDQDRVQMTEAVKRWIVRDLRVDHMGHKVVA